METKVPLRDVVVKWRDGKSSKTIWDGSFLIDSEEDCMKDIVRLSKPGYLERVMPMCNLTDTIELLPSYNKLAEVVIWGKRRDKNVISFSMRPPTKDEIAESKGPAVGASVGIGDVMLGIENLINHKKRKRTKKIKESLVGY